LRRRLDCVRHGTGPQDLTITTSYLIITPSLRNSLDLFASAEAIRGWAFTSATSHGDSLGKNKNCATDFPGAHV
jgi:hypothetical protein